MLRRRSTPIVYRVFALVLAALFFNSSTVDALALERCPHHGTAALMQGADEQESAAAASSAATTAAPDHSAHGAGHDTAVASTQSDDAHAPTHGECTCLGDCAGAPTLALPAHQAYHAPIVTTIDPTTAHSLAETRASRHLELLPYGNAPPAH